MEKGKELYGKEKYEEAREKFSGVIRLKKDHWEAYYWRGFAFFGLKKYKEAVQDYTTSLLHVKLTKDEYVVLGSRAVAFNLLKKHEEAITDCNTATKLCEKDSRAYYHRGNAYLGLHRYNDSIRDCSKSIELNKSKPYPYYYRGMAYKNLGKCSESSRDLSKAIELSVNYLFFRDLYLEDAKRTFDEVSRQLPKKRMSFVQEFFSCQDSVVIAKISTRDVYEVFFLGKRSKFGGKKKSKVYEGSIWNGKFHGEGTVFDQETGKELYKGIWDEGRLISCKSGRKDLKTLLPVFQRLQKEFEENSDLKKDISLSEVKKRLIDDVTTQVSSFKTKVSVESDSSGGFEASNPRISEQLGMKMKQMKRAFEEQKLKYECKLRKKDEELIFQGQQLRKLLDEQKKKFEKGTREKEVPLRQLIESKGVIRKKDASLRQLRAVNRRQLEVVSNGFKKEMEDIKRTMRNELETNFERSRDIFVQEQKCKFSHDNAIQLQKMKLMYVRDLEKLEEQKEIFEKLVKQTDEVKQKMKKENIRLTKELEKSQVKIVEHTTLDETQFIPSKSVGRGQAGEVFKYMLRFPDGSKKIVAAKLYAKESSVVSVIEECQKLTFIQHERFPRCYGVFIGARKVLLMEHSNKTWLNTFETTWILFPLGRRPK